MATQSLFFVACYRSTHESRSHTSAARENEWNMTIAEVYLMGKEANRRITMITYYWGDLTVADRVQGYLMVPSNGGSDTSSIIVIMRQLHSAWAPQTAI